jgi:hypothetical protein
VTSRPVAIKVSTSVNPRGQLLVMPQTVQRACRSLCRTGVEFSRMIRPMPDWHGTGGDQFLRCERRREDADFYEGLGAPELTK